MELSPAVRITILARPSGWVPNSPVKQLSIVARRSFEAMNIYFKHLISFSLLATLFVILGCDEEPLAVNTLTVTYIGELRWDKSFDPDLVGGNGLDTVRLRISGINYVYTLLTNKAQPPISGVVGIMSGFGTDSVTFTPTFYDCPSPQCDTVHTLRNTLMSRFVGDSLYLTGEWKDGAQRQMSYDFRMVQTSQ